MDQGPAPAGREDPPCSTAPWAPRCKPEGLQPGESPELWGLAHREGDLVGKSTAPICRPGRISLKTNTFGANRFKLEGTGHTVEEVVTAGVRKRPAGGGGLRPRARCFWTSAPQGSCSAPWGSWTLRTLVSAFGEMVHAGAAAPAPRRSCIETMSDIYEAKAALLAAKENSDLPVFVTMTFDRGRQAPHRREHRRGGSSAGRPGRRRHRPQLRAGAPADGGPPPQAPGSLPACQLVVNPNAGLPVERDGHNLLRRRALTNSPAGWVKSPGAAPG